MSNLNGGLSGSGTLRGTLGGGGVPAQDVYWDDILNKPNFAAVATSGSYNDLVNKPTFATVATSGSYNDLTDKPTIPAAQVNADWNATSGVAEILNKPTIPAAQVNADWNATSGVAEILNKPTIPTTASQIDYDNTTSGLQADDVQDAITELKSNLTHNVTFDYYEKSGTTDNRGLLLITGLPYNYIPMYVENFSLVTTFFNGSGSTYSPYVQIKNYDNTYYTNQYVTLKIRCMVVDGLEAPT